MHKFIIICVHLSECIIYSNSILVIIGRKNL